MNDLFETPENLPIEIIDLMHEFSKMNNSYNACKIMLRECLKIGYTFEYGLDAIPFNLKKL
jgi:hypothetical protein